MFSLGQFKYYLLREAFLACFKLTKHPTVLRSPPRNSTESPTLFSLQHLPPPKTVPMCLLFSCLLFTTESKAQENSVHAPQNPIINIIHGICTTNTGWLYELNCATTIISSTCRALKIFILWTVLDLRKSSLIIWFPATCLKLRFYFSLQMIHPFQPTTLVPTHTSWHAGDM